MTEIDTKGVSRRRIIQGAAWATPAIVLATAVPAAANTSPDPVVMPDFGIRRGSSVAANIILDLRFIVSTPDNGAQVTQIDVEVTFPAGGPASSGWGNNQGIPTWGAISSTATVSSATWLGTMSAGDFTEGRMRFDGGQAGTYKVHAVWKDQNGDAFTYDEDLTIV